MEFVIRMSFSSIHTHFMFADMISAQVFGGRGWQRI
jgi:hypothetical protein